MHSKITNNLIAILIVLCLEINFVKSDQEEIQSRLEELCFRETFRPQCSNSEIIIVNKARYGRMKIGKCLTEDELQAVGVLSKDPRYYGCFNDVSTILNKKCALKSSCELKIVDLEDIENRACLKGLTMYLEIDYSCLPIVKPTDSCQIFPSSRPKFMNPQSFAKDYCGSPDKQLLTIEVPKGQRIKLTHDFFRVGEETVKTESCDTEIGILTEPRIDKNTTICENGFKSQRNWNSLEAVVSSQGNLFRMMFNRDIKHAFLIKLKAEGCLDIIPPEDTWLKRNNDDIVIGCYSSKHTWYLRCENGQWIGAIGNCSVTNSVSDKKIEPGLKGDKIDLPETQQILIIIAICGFGAVVCLTIICAGAVCLKRMNAKQSKNTASYNFMSDQYYNQKSTNGTTLNRDKFVLSGPLSVSGAGTQQRPLNRSTAGGDQREDEDRYQILDKEEVARECSAFL